MLPLAKATIKNRVESSQWNASLVRIEKEKQNELRMINNEQQRFKAKYAKTSSTSSDISESSDVKMYETHNPGFCFRRNGDHRTQQPPAARPGIDFKHLHFLLFTDGEVDVDKLLCLHLLSFHETRHLAPPKQLKSSNTFLKRDSPVEQLLERSAGSSNDISAFTMLPTYILDVHCTSREKILKDDQRLTNRLLINEKILSLVETVLTTLQSSNPGKFEILTETAKDPSSLKRLFTKDHIQDFLLALRDHTLLHNCSCFMLTAPLKEPQAHIEMKTATGSLEALINSIRSNVLQLSNRFRYRNFSTTCNLLGEDNAEMEQDVATTSREKQKKVGLEEHQEEVNKKNRRQQQQQQQQRGGFFEEEEEEEEEVKVRRNSVNFIARNIAAAAGGLKKVREKSSVSLKRPSLRSGNSAESNVNAAVARGILLSDRLETVKEDSTEDLLESSERSQQMQSQVRILDPQEEARLAKEHEHHVRVHLKQTTCLACMEKWRTPLPKPKVSSLNKLSNSSGVALVRASLTEEQQNELSSRQRLGMLIEREEYKLNSYDRKYSLSDVGGNSVYLVNKKQNVIKENVMFDLDLNVYHMEKIKQEIREREAQKKLDRFLYA